MKVLNPATNGIATLEVIECDCGYHMGVDASFVEQVDDAFFHAKTICPSCRATIDVRNLLEMEPLEVEIEVSRSCTAYRMVAVAANSIEDANGKAIDTAEGFDFSEKDASYNATDHYDIKG